MLQPFSRFDFAKRDAIVVAVSGGSDSTALLHLLKQHIDLNGRTRLIAVTVDHGLRRESATEARLTAAFAASLGVAHRTIAWTGDKPATGLAAAARDARYRLLAEVAAAEGADVIVTGHTADDQAETVAMRTARGTGRGLAGMAPATLYGGRIWIARPLLSTTRATLRDHLRKHGFGWVDDPTNADDSFERPRIRARLADHDDPGPAELLEIARIAGAERGDLGERAARLITQHAHAAAPGLFRIAPAFLEEPDHDASIYALRLLLSVIGGAAHLPDDERVRKLAGELAMPGFRATLSRTMIATRRDGTYFCRERRELPGLRAAEEGLVWDRRFRLARTPDATPATVVAAERAAPGMPAASRDGAPKGMARIASATLPHIEPATGSEEPVATGWSAQPALAPWLWFLPSFDLAPARALALLVGAPPPPAPPLLPYLQDHLTANGSSAWQCSPASLC